MSSWSQQTLIKLQNDFRKIYSGQHTPQDINGGTIKNNSEKEVADQPNDKPGQQQIENLLTSHLQELHIEVQMEKVSEISRRLSLHNKLSFHLYSAALKLLSADWDSLIHVNSIKDLFNIFDHDNDGMIYLEDKEVAERAFFLPNLVQEVCSKDGCISSEKDVFSLKDFQKGVIKLTRNELTVSEMKHLLDKTGLDRKTIMDLYNQYKENKAGGKDGQLELERFISMMYSQLPASEPRRHSERCKHLYRVFSGSKDEATGLSFKQLLLCLKLLRANTLEQILDQETLKILFRLHDIDGNGWISWEEGQEMYSVLDFVDWVDLVGVKIWWSLFDENMDERISLQEFLSGCAKIADMFCTDDKIME